MYQNEYEKIDNSRYLSSGIRKGVRAFTLYGDPPYDAVSKFAVHAEALSTHRWSDTGIDVVHKQLSKSSCLVGFYVSFGDLSVQVSLQPCDMYEQLPVFCIIHI